MNYSECILAIVNFYHFEHIGVNQYMFLINFKEQETVEANKEHISKYRFIEQQTSKVI